MKQSLLLCLFLIVVIRSQFNIKQHLGTKSPYPEPTTHKKVNQDECPNGELLHINFLARHGTRNPIDGSIKDLFTLSNALEIYGKYITNPNFQWLQSWENPYLYQTQGLLVEAGEIQHYNLSKRMMSQYETLQTPYLPPYYTIQHTSVYRTGRSASSFAFGLFEGKGALGPSNFQPFYQFSLPSNIDITLRFFDNCPNYINNVLKNNQSTYESDMYLRSVIPYITTKVAIKLGIDPNEWLPTYEEVKALYLACQLDVSINNIEDKFCALFDEDDIIDFEIVEDLLNYWTKGYGYPINYQIGCPLLVDFFNAFDQVISQTSSEKNNLRFAHAETLIPFACLLGLFDDGEPLQWNSTFLNNRKFKSSQISPYCGNIAMALYNCSGTYKVQLIYNEEVISFPQCGGSLYCPYDFLKQAFGEYLNCGFDQMCGIP